MVDLGGDTPTASVLAAAKECVAAVHRRFPSLPVLAAGVVHRD